MGYCNVTKQAHHVIPWELRTEPFVQLAARDGFHLNDYPNGIYLNKYSGCYGAGSLLQPSMGFHNGSHPNYSTYVKDIMNYYNNNSSKYRTPEKAYELIYCGIIPYLKGRLSSAEADAVARTTAFYNRVPGSSAPPSLNGYYNNWQHSTQFLNGNNSNLPIIMPGYPL